MKHIKMILTNGFDPDIRVYKEAKYLVQQGNDVEILCWDRENRHPGKSTETVDGIQVKRFFIDSVYGSGFKQIFAMHTFICQCRNYLKDKPVDFYHCHDLDGIVCGRCLRHAKAKLVFDMHEFYEGRCSGKMKKAMHAAVCYYQNRSDRIIYVNDTQKDAISPKNQKKLIFLPNYPDAANFSFEKVPSKNLRVGYIGGIRRFDLMKNLFDAGAGLNGVSVAVHGIGTDYDKLKAIEHNYSNVVMTGWYNGTTQSKPLYQNIDVQYCVYDMNVVNWKNAYPIKLFESIITGTPVIVSRGSLIESFVLKNGIGFSVTWNDVKEMRALIEKLAQQPNLVLDARNNMEKIHRNYLWESVVQNLDAIYY